MAAVSYDPPTDLPDSTLLYTSCQRIAAIPDASERGDAISTLFKLIDGVLASPEDVKKRRVKKGNETFHRKVGRFAAAVEFLRAAGFVDSDDPDSDGAAAKNSLLAMPVAYLLRLTDAHHMLTQVAKTVGVDAPALPSGGGAFNPYMSNRQAADTTATAKVPSTWADEASRVRDELKRRRQEMKEKVESAPPVDPNPTVFWLSAGRRLDDVIRETATAADGDRSADNALLQAQVARAKAAIAGPGNFENADKRELEELTRKRVHEFCLLRVVCPDKAVLQVRFRAIDRGQQVMQTIAPLLSQQVQAAGFYLYQSPPLKRLGLQETLAAAGFTPGANLYLGFEGGARLPAPYLREDLMSQLGAAPEPPQGARGVSSGPTFSGEAMGWGAGHTLGGAGGGVSPSGGKGAARTKKLPNEPVSGA